MDEFRLCCTMTTQHGSLMRHSIDEDPSQNSKADQCKHDTLQYTKDPSCIIHT
ncbi:hypothetical protein BKA67DRAFT_575319, partial [Truncatella angustata]